jgi:hypothetical protein
MGDSVNAFNVEKQYGGRTKKGVNFALSSTTNVPLKGIWDAVWAYTLLQIVNEVLYSIEQLQNQSKRQYGVVDVRAWKPMYA